MVDPRIDDSEERPSRSDLLLATYLAVLLAVIGAALSLLFEMTFGFAGPAVAVAAVVFIPPCPVLSFAALARAVSRGDVQTLPARAVAAVVFMVDFGWTGLFPWGMSQEGLPDAILFACVYGLLGAVVAVRAVAPGGALRLHEWALIGGCLSGAVLVLTRRAFSQGSTTALVLALGLASATLVSGTRFARRYRDTRP